LAICLQQRLRYRITDGNFDEPPTISGEDVLPGFVLNLTPILNP
jgi:hypothetical protein